MTLYATREGQKITISGNTGVDLRVENSRLDHVRITEDANHLRYFWHQLGEHLDAAENEAAAAAEVGSGTLTRDEKAAEVAAFLTGGER